jgi:hypothetical protein
VPWFKVDDTLANHPKARAAGPAAMGLWVLAGSYASGYLTDGHVPEWYVDSWPGGRKLAARLVEVGLWNVAEGDAGGWRFHQWNDDGRQPTRSEVEERRAYDRERKAEARAQAAKRREQERQLKAVPE